MRSNQVSKNKIVLVSLQLTLKYLELLYSSKTMYSIDSIHLKYLILETPYNFSLYSVGILVLGALNALSPVFPGINNNNFFLFCLKDMDVVIYLLWLFLQL